MRFLLLGLPLLLLAYCAVPLTSVVSINIHLVDQDGYPVETPAAGLFRDKGGEVVARIEAKRFVGDIFSLQWWAHSDSYQSFMRPSDALRVKTVEIQAEGCKTATIPLEMKKEYVSFSLSPHGGGPSYFYYTAEPTATLECKIDKGRLQKLAMFNLHRRLFKVLSEAIYGAEEQGRFQPADFEKMDLT